MLTWSCSQLTGDMLRPATLPIVPEWIFGNCDFAAGVLSKMTTFQPLYRETVCLLGRLSPQYRRTYFMSQAHQICSY